MGSCSRCARIYTLSAIYSTSRKGFLCGVYAMLCGFIRFVMWPRGLFTRVLCARSGFASTRRSSMASQSVVIHGTLEKKSLGKSLSTRVFSSTGVVSWKFRYIVVFQTEVRWYEKAETDAKGNAIINSKRCGYLTLGPDSILEKNSDYESGKYWTFSVQQHPSSPLKLVMRARSDAERTDWTSAIEGVLSDLKKADPFSKPAPKATTAAQKPSSGMSFPDPPPFVPVAPAASEPKAAEEEEEPRPRLSITERITAPAAKLGARISNTGRERRSTVTVADGVDDTFNKPIQRPTKEVCASGPTQPAVPPSPQSCSRHPLSVSTTAARLPRTTGAALQPVARPEVVRRPLRLATHRPRSAHRLRFRQGAARRRERCHAVLQVTPRRQQR